MSLKKNDVEKLCAYCEHATFTCQEEKMLCDKKGIVFTGYKCRKFSYDPQKRVPSKKFIATK